MSLSAHPSSGAPRAHTVTAVVIVAHGPTGTTLTAAGRASALVGQDSVRVVAGTEPGLTAVARAEERGYVVGADHGPQAIVDTLAQLASDATVAIMHDDLALADDGLMALAAAHDGFGLVAVPSGKRRGKPSEITTAQLTCAVGTVAQLINLAATSSFGPGYPAVGRFVQVPVGAIHDASCRTQMSPLPTKNAPPLLVASLIVRDEANNIEAAIASLTGVVDRVEVVDTGSLDDTVELAQAAGANVTEVAWQNDFAHARNVALDQCRDATFMLWIDADERLVCSDRRRFRNVLHTYSRLYGAYRLEINNVSDADDDQASSSFWARRIVTTDGTRFEGAIHEQARRVDGQPLVEVQSALCSIDHYGYADDVVRARQKNARNLALAKASYEADPNAERALHYARTMAGAGADAQEALDVFDEVADFVAAAPTTVQAMMLALKAKLLLDLSRLDEAIEVATQATDLVPAEPVGRAVLAQALLQAGRFHDVLVRDAHLATLPSEAPTISDNVAWAMRARAVFEASVAVGDAAGASALLDELPDGYDPWPNLSQRLSAEDMAALADQAARNRQDGFVTALAARPDLRRHDLMASVRAFADLGRTFPDDVVRVLESRLDVQDQAPQLREAFLSDQSTANATAYAAAVCAGDVGLKLELEACPAHAHGAALAMGVAAEGLRRRGLHEEATADAVIAVELWPGALNAIDILAQSATANGMADVALDIIEAARGTGALDNATRERRHGLINRAVEANLALGNMAAAASEALVLIEQQGCLTAWDQMLLVAADNSQHLAVVLGLALLGDGEDFVHAAASTLVPEKTAEVCAAYLVSGGSNPAAVTTGVLAALIGGVPEIGDVVAGYADLLEPAVAARVAEHVREAGASELADRLSQDVSVGV